MTHDNVSTDGHRASERHQRTGKSGKGKEKGKSKADNCEVKGIALVTLALLTSVTSWNARRLSA